MTIKKPIKEDQQKLPNANIQQTKTSLSSTLCRQIVGGTCSTLQINSQQSPEQQSLARLQENTLFESLVNFAKQAENILQDKVQT